MKYDNYIYLKYEIKIIISFTKDLILEFIEHDEEIQYFYYLNITIKNKKQIYELMKKIGIIINLTLRFMFFIKISKIVQIFRF